MVVVHSLTLSAGTVYSIKTEMFYGRSMGTGVQIYAYGRTS